ncbi:hypothetical protein ACFVFS_17225 [Kitasatospora sp. NPDC057692]|uniref:hypothetical protein n=1 Tax=Kitasatospora sp. NPDC057692 TaxID=3346215 RepID=UPI0036996A2D
MSGADVESTALGLEVAVKLEQIRGTMETGFATLNGRLDVALTRTTQVESEVAQLRAEVEALKRSRWPLPTIAVLASLAGVAIALVPFLSR